jgi:2',3'-cyclic-nucleotide 2'-phosphodiesterase/3'-nucleotidase
MLKLKFFFISIIIIVAFSSSLIPAQTDTLIVKFIETSDVHGSLFPYDFNNKLRSINSLGNIYTYIKSERAKKNQEVVLLDNGDILQGSPLTYYYNVEKNLFPNICSDVMNYIKYDAATIGNHDIETGHAVYDKVRKEFNFPWLAANTIDTANKRTYFQPYAIINKGGLKIAVLGLTTPYVPNWLPENLWRGIVFEDMIVSAKKWAPVIREKEKPDMLIGLFHSGVEYDYNHQTAETPCNENASLLVAEKVPGFDLVFVGHDHVGWNRKIKNIEGKEVLILGTSANANNIAAADYAVIRQNGIIKSISLVSGNLFETRKFEVDKNYLTRYVGVIKEVNKFVSKEVANFSETISTRESMFGNSAFVDLIHSIQLYFTKADISFSAPLSFDAKISKGPVFIKDMFTFYKYENFLYTMKLTGREIKDYLEFSFENWFNQMKSPDDNLLLFKKDADGNIITTNNVKSFQLKGQYYNFCSAAGIIYTVDVTKPAGRKVNIISMQNGTPFEMDKTYKVALNSYRGNGGGGHLTEGAKIPREELKHRLISSTPRDLRFYIIRWMEMFKEISPKPFNNWKLIPEDWVKNAKVRDYLLLYGN